MRRENVIRNILHELRKDEKILYVMDKCVWNFMYIFVLFSIISVFSFHFTSLILKDVFEYFNSYSISEFTSDDIFRFLLVSILLLFAIGPLIFLIFSIISFLKNELIITDQRLIFLTFGKIMAFERKNIIGIDSDRFCDKSFIRSVVISTKKENLQLLGKSETLWNKINSIQMHTFLFYNHKKVEEKLQETNKRVNYI